MQYGGAAVMVDRDADPTEQRFVKMWRLVVGKRHPREGLEGPIGEYMYSSTVSLTSAVDTGGWSTPGRAHFTPSKDSVPIV